MAGAPVGGHVPDGRIGDLVPLGVVEVLELVEVEECDDEWPARTGGVGPDCARLEVESAAHDGHRVNADHDAYDKPEDEEGTGRQVERGQDGDQRHPPRDDEPRLREPLRA